MQSPYNYSDHRRIDEVWRRKDEMNHLFFSPAKAELFIVVLLLPRNQSHLLPAYVSFHVDQTE